MGCRVPAQRSGTTVPVEAGRERTGPLGVRPESEVCGARSPDRRRPCGASTIGDLGQADAEAFVARVDRPLAAGLGILDHEQADIGKSELARVEDLDGDDLASACEPRKRRAPGIGGSDEVRDHDREPNSPQDVPEIVDRATEVDLSPERRSLDAPHEARQMPSTTADGHDPRTTGGRRDRADPIAAEDGERRHGRCDADGQIGLPPADGPEVEAAGPVDEDGDVEVALLDRVPDVRFARPGKDRPIHPADVVTRLVRSCLAGLDTVAEHERRMTAVPAPDDLAADRELDAAEPCREVEPGTGCRRHRAAGGSPGMIIGGVPTASA